MATAVMATQSAAHLAASAGAAKAVVAAGSQMATTLGPAGPSVRYP